MAGLLYVAFKPIEPSLKARIREIKSKANPSIGEKLNIESTKQVFNIIKQIKYRPDTRDYTQTPEETLALKEGDCEDIAVLSYSLLDYLGLNPDIAIAWNEGEAEAHAFVYYWCDYCGEYVIISNNDVFRAPSVEEAANMLGFENVVYNGGVCKCQNHTSLMQREMKECHT